MTVVHRMSGPDRLRYVDGFVGQVVEVTYSIHRGTDTARTTSGTLVTVAAPITGAATELAIVYAGHGRPSAISLATIITIEALVR
jgi:hypothetical protein